MAVHTVWTEMSRTIEGARVTSEPLDPVAALRRIAFLLERRLADSYRIKAYRGAAATLLTQTPDEVRARAEAGTLRQLPGIGAKTAAIVEQCLAGEVPAYLTELEATAGPLVEGGEAYRAALRGDLHTHSDWSDGGSPIEEMAMTALELGHEYVVLTDHSPRLTVANGLSVARLTRQLEVVEAVDEHLGDGFRLLKGIEVDILDDGSLDQTDAMLDRLDVVVASVHSKLRMDSAPMTRRMLGAVRNPRTNVLGHCTGRLVKGGRGTQAAERVRRGGGVRGVRRARRGRRDQLATRALRPARRPGGARPGGRLPVLDRQRRARPGAARLPRARRRAGRAARRPAGPDRHDVARATAAGVGEPVICLT